MSIVSVEDVAWILLDSVCVDGLVFMLMSLSLLLKMWLRVVLLRLGNGVILLLWLILLILLFGFDVGMFVMGLGGWLF